MKTAPAFQFYASDMIADRRYRLMSLEERGLLISLLCECWVNRSVPANPADLGKWLGYQEEKIMPTLTPNLLSFFESKNEELISPELERYRAEILAQREKMSQGGKKGQQIRRMTNPLSSPPEGHPQGSRVEMSRDEVSRSESLVKGDPKSYDPWLRAYDESYGDCEDSLGRVPLGQGG